MRTNIVDNQPKKDTIELYITVLSDGAVCLKLMKGDKEEISHKHLRIGTLEKGELKFE